MNFKVLQKQDIESGYAGYNGSLRKMISIIFVKKQSITGKKFQIHNLVTKDNVDGLIQEQKNPTKG